MYMRLSTIQQKILLVLLGGTALGFSASPTTYFRNLRLIHRAWREIDQQSFNRSFKTLTHHKLVEPLTKPDGTITFKLTPEGKRHAQGFQIFQAGIDFKKPQQWDGLWRIICFDIPQANRFFRDTLRMYLYTIGFKKIQQSVFVFPYPCEKELKQLINLYQAEAYVTLMTAKTFDKEKEFRRKFKV